MPSVSWAYHLDIDIVSLQMERPGDSFQTQLAALHTERGEAYATHTRLVDTPKMLTQQIQAWEKYISLTRSVCDYIGAPVPADIMMRHLERQQTTKEAVLNNTCDRCGFVWKPRQIKFVGGLCASCLALQEKVLRRGRLSCQPWQGRFAPDDVTPVNAAGVPVMPGRRVCQNSDCVNPKHIRKGRN